MGSEGGNASVCSENSSEKKLGRKKNGGKIQKFWKVKWEMLLCVLGILFRIL